MTTKAYDKDRDDRPIPSTSGPQTYVTLKLPCGWERDPEKPDVLTLRLPSSEIPEAIRDQLRASLGDFADMAMEQVYKLSVLKALKDSML